MTNCDLHCILQFSAVDCVMGTWSAWGTCSVTCASGTQTRTRSITTQQVGTGAACGATSEQQACATGVSCRKSLSTTIFNEICHKSYQETMLKNALLCFFCISAVDCVMSAWSAWSACSATQCGTGTQTRTRTITTQAAHGGTACGSTSENQSCDSGVTCRESFSIFLEVTC